MNTQIKRTRIDREECCTDYGQFRRKGLALYEDTDRLVSVRADIPDTWFTIPAHTATEHGYVRRP
jgi:hypothetical protein